MSDLLLILRDFLSDFIHLYREHVCLWKVKSLDSSKKQKKNAVYEILIEKLQAVIKKNSLRTCFRVEKI